MFMTYDSELKGSGVISWNDKMSAVDRTEWDALNPDSLFLTAAWLRLVETDPLRGAVPRRYFVFRNENGALLGALPAYRFEKAPSWLYDPAGRLATEAHRHEAWRPLVIAGGCADFRSECILRDDLTLGESARVGGQLIAAARSWAEETGSALCLMYISEAEVSRCGLSMADERVRFLDTEYSVWTHGGYTQAVYDLPGKKRREMGREQRSFERAGGRMSICSLFDAPIERMAQLRANLMRKHGHGFQPSAALAGFCEQRELLGSAAQVMLASDQGGEVIGYALHVVHRGHWYARSAGFDYQSSIPFAYPHVTIYGPLRAAAEHNIEAIHLGLSSASAKLARGAIGKRLYGYLEPAAAGFASR